MRRMRAYEPAGSHSRAHLPPGSRARTIGVPAPTPLRSDFAARAPSGLSSHFATYALAMMADNIEHVISYWVP